MIKVQNLSRHFKVWQKDAGVKATLKGFFKRDYILKKAVDNLSFEIKEGEIVGLIGANGAGKTTLVKMLSGIVHPSSGSASVLGYTPWQREKEFRKQISVVMGQKAQLWWDLPASDSFDLLKEIYEIPTKIFKDNLEELISLFEVKGLMKTQVRRLSLGERMKFELIAALLHNPMAVFLDEPTIGLDFNAQKAVRQFILNYRRKFNPIMIVTSHYLEDIESLCEKIFIIKDGQFVYEGSLDHLKSKYSSKKNISLRIEPDDALKLLNLCQKESACKILSQDSKSGEFEIQVAKTQANLLLESIIKETRMIDLDVKNESLVEVISEIMKNSSPASEYV